MLGAGTVINPIIKVITTVAILAAVYFFIVKPVLDTTDNAFESFDIDGLSNSIQSQVDDAFDTASDGGRLQDCLERATRNGVDQEAIQRCIERHGS